MLAFIAFRWWARLEPINSDDLVLFESVKHAAAGGHWLFADTLTAVAPPDPLCLSCDGGGLSHQALRIGLLPIALPALWLLGPSLAAYYVVPLFFQTLGAIAVWLLLRRHVGARWAWLGTGMLAIMPFELAHASLFLVDLPAAACLLWALWALDTPRVPSPVLRGVAAGLWLGWAYLLRENAPILLLPSLLLLARAREQRRSIVSCLGTLTACYLLEQLVYIAKGLGFGYRAAMVAKALDTYAPHLPVYDLATFAHRQFSEYWSQFGDWLAALAGAWLIAILAIQLWVVFRSQSHGLRALAALGLTTFAIFAYAPYSVTGGRIVALASTSPRYLQPYFYTGLVCAHAVLQCGLRHLQTRLESIALHGGREVEWWRSLAVPRGAASLLWAALACGWLATDLKLDRLQRPKANLLASLAKLEKAVALSGGDDFQLWGPRLETRALSLVGAAQGSPLRFRDADVNELTAQLTRDPSMLLLRDFEREAMARRYLSPDAQRARERAALQLITKLKQTHGLLVLGRRILFVPRSRLPQAAAQKDAVPVPGDGPQ